MHPNITEEDPVVCQKVMWWIITCIARFTMLTVHSYDSVSWLLMVCGC